MKTYKITFTKDGKKETWTEKSGMGLINTLKYFSNTMNVSIDDIVNTDIEEVETLTDEEKEAYYHQDEIEAQIAHESMNDYGDRY